jgi:hypothetical protein
MELTFEEEFGRSDPVEDSDSRAILHSDLIASKREDPDFLINIAAGFQASQDCHGLDICPVSLLPLLPDSPRKSTFRRGGRSYQEAASVEFATDSLLSPRYSKDTYSTGASVTPEISPRMFTDADLSPRFSQGRRLRRGSRIMLDAAQDERRDVVDGRGRRRSCNDIPSYGAAGRALPHDRRSSRFRALAQRALAQQHII